jgi:hypothetical protein
MKKQKLLSLLAFFLLCSSVQASDECVSPIQTTSATFASYFNKNLPVIFSSNNSSYLMTILQKINLKAGVDFILIEPGLSKIEQPVVYIYKVNGQISRCLYGSEFHEKDIRFALIEASDRKVGTAFDRILLYGFHFDSARNSYTIDLWRIVGFVMVLQALLFGVFFFIFWKKK